MPFYIDQQPTLGEISEALNYLLSNINTSTVGNATTGQIIGSNGTVVAYLYQYLNVKYADSYDGTLNFSNSSYGRQYYGLRNNDSSVESTSPADYVWTKVTGGFGSTLSLWYLVTGGRNIQLAVSATKPADGYQQDTGAAIDLDSITTAAATPAYVIIYRAANDNSAPTNTEFQASIGRNPINGDTSTISYNGGANSIQYKYTTVWTVMSKYITGDIIQSLTGYYGAIETVTHEDFDSAISAPSYKEGRVFYDNVEKSLAYYNDNNQVTVNVGQESLIRVYNNTGVQINNGELCYINGSNLGFATVALAKANVSATSDATIGMATCNISNGGYGYIDVMGTVHNLNTSGLTAGQVLYLSDSVAGAWTTTPPLQPSYIIIVGYVINVDTSAGSMFIHVDKQKWFPYIEILDATASVTLPSTPTVYVAPTVVASSGITYDNSTGIVTINQNGSYSISIEINATPPSANKKVYFYVESKVNGGSWITQRYTARSLELPNSTSTQLTVTAAKYYAANTQIRFNIWGSASGVTLTTVDLIAGTVTVPAYRFLMAG